MSSTRQPTWLTAASVSIAISPSASGLRVLIITATAAPCSRVADECRSHARPKMSGHGDRPVAT